MDIIHQAVITHYHKKLIETHGIGSAESLGWVSEKTARIRYETLSNIGDISNKAVMDLGCGYGDLLSYLDEKFTNVRYIGIDILPQFIDFAKQRFKDRKNATFMNNDFSNLKFQAVDYALASGAFSYDAPNGLPHINFTFNMIDKMFGCARIGIAFNMLDATQFQAGKNLMPYSIDEVQTFCKTLATKVSIEKNSLENEFTVFMHH